jgi:hypothetical protein
MIMFYYEQKNVFGKWAPQTQPDERPSSKSSSGSKLNIRNVHEIPPELEGLSLGALERHFNPQFVQDDAPPVYDEMHAIKDLLLRLESPRHITAADGQEAATLIRSLLANTLLDPAWTITALANQVHADNVAAGWWTDLKTGEDLHGKRNIPEMLMLIVSEVSEAMEGHRKRLMDDKLPHRPMLRVELIDAMIRMLDLLGCQDNDEHPAGVIFQEKRAYNAQRADHKPEARLAAGGKAF